MAQVAQQTGTTSAPPGGGQELPIEGKTIKALTLLSLKRTFDMFVGNHGQKLGLDEDSQKLKIACKIRDEYSSVKRYKPKEVPDSSGAGTKAGAAGKRSEAAALARAGESKSTLSKIIDSVPDPSSKSAPRAKGQQLVVHGAAGTTGITPAAKAALAGTVMVPTATGGKKEYTPSATLARRLPSKWPRPAWHPPWKIYRVIAGHLGWVRSVAFDPANEWFCTGSADRTIKIWDTASGQLKLTLTGHIEQVTGLTVSPRHPYMFSCGLDKMVKCWDLEQNKVIRNYHGHLSGIYSIAQHPTLDILMTGGRDSVCRVWDMRTKVQVHCLSGHEDNVAAILAQPTDPQVITASHDKTIRLWDLRTGKTLSTLTYHKKAIRALAAHPQEYTFASGAADNVKKFKLPRGEFLHNFLQQPKAIVNCMAINEDGVVATGADNGAMWCWDYRSGNAFQQGETVSQPGSLEAEQGIYAMSFDMTGSRLVTCEADKTVKMWREDETATPETHPINFRPPKDIKRF